LETSEEVDFFFVGAASRDRSSFQRRLVAATIEAESLSHKKTNSLADNVTPGVLAHLTRLLNPEPRTLSSYVACAVLPLRRYCSNAKMRFQVQQEHGNPRVVTLKSPYG